MDGVEADAPAPLVASPARPPDRGAVLPPEAVATVMAAYMDAINRRDDTVLTGLLAADYVHHWPFGHDTVGAEADLANLQRVAEVFPDLTVKADQILVSENLGAIVWTATGTQSIPFLGFPPSEHSATWSGLHVHRLAEGKIAETWTQADHLGRLQQQGAIPTPVARQKS